MKSRISAVAVVALLLGGTVTLHAQTYEWTDAGGVIHFTDNQEMVPRKYRGAIRVRESVRSTSDDQVPQPQAAPAKTTGQATGERLYGGKPLPWWQARYLGLAGERAKVVERLEEAKGKETATKRKKLILQRAKDRAAVKEVEEQIEGQEERLRGIDAAIAELEGEAQRAGVPPRWKELPVR